MKQKIICGIAMCMAVLYCVGLIVAACTNAVPEIQSPEETSAMVLGYEDKIFASGIVHDVQIQLPEDDWESLKTNALYKECYDAMVTVDGETFYHVGLRTKGNVTLIQSILRDWDRYSLVVDFGAFDGSQRYYGLDQLVLNNNICDSSFMRDYLCYDMMRSLGVPAPLISFTAVYLNGEYLGLYTAIENMAESYCVRNFGYEYGNLYKPEHMNIADMLTGEEQNCKLNLSALSSEGGSVDAADFMGVTDTTVALQYQGEKLAAYADLWDNAVFNIGTSDKQRMIEAIRTINEGGDVSGVLDTDTLLRYFAVNSFVLNDDCYTSYAGHNYGLYEKNGVLTMLPWDYDHSLGCMGAASGSSSWTELINLPIDQPLICTTLEQRPLLNCLLSDAEYRAQYYALLDEFLTDYVESGHLEATVGEIENLILPYIQRESQAGISEERFHAAVQSNLDFCTYRSASIRGQLNGTIPRTAESQKAAPETLVDCSDFVSPDSGSLSQLLFPEGSGLYFEDLIEALVPRINTMATVAILPFDTILNLIGLGGAEGSFVDTMIASGKVNDPDALRAGIGGLVLNFVKDVSDLVTIPIFLAGAYAIAFGYGKKRHAQARKKGEKNHAI